MNERYHGLRTRVIRSIDQQQPDWTRRRRKEEGLQLPVRASIRGEMQIEKYQGIGPAQQRGSSGGDGVQDECQ